MDEQRTHGAANGNREGKEESSIVTKSNRYAGGRQFRFIYDIDLPFTQKFMLHAIASYLPVDVEQPFSEKTAWPGHEELVELTGMSKTCAKNSVRELVEAGFVLKEARFAPSGKQETNLYRIEPTLPAFYEYRDLLKRSKRAPLRELTSIDVRFQAISHEIWLDLRLDERDLKLLAAEKPGLYERRVKGWIESEVRRGVYWCELSASSDQQEDGGSNGDFLQ